MILYKKHILIAIVSIFIASFFTLSLSAAEEVEVHHWWTSGGEAAALQVLKKDLENKGITWKDSGVAGGGGAQAMTALKARISAGTPPTAVQMLGFDINDWAELGYLADLNNIAKEDNWDSVIPKALQRFSKYNGVWVAAPVNVHSVNWVWGNREILSKVGVKKSDLKTWDNFIKAAKKVQAAGYIAFAHGGQDWQDATVFDSIIYATGGRDFYIKTMIEQDTNAIKSATMRRAFDRFREFGNLLDDNFSGREWSQTTALVINGEAAFQIMGDWAKGEFVKAGKKPNSDFVCFRVPGTQEAVLFNSDQFAMIEVGDNRRDAQEAMAKAVMDPSFQSTFNVVKGSVPARVDVPNTAFDFCGKKGMLQLATANNNNTMLGSMAHGHAGKPAIKNAYFDVVTTFLNDASMSSREASSNLANAIFAAQE